MNQISIKKKGKINMSIRETTISEIIKLLEKANDKMISVVYTLLMLSGTDIKETSSTSIETTKQSKKESSAKEQVKSTKKEDDDFDEVVESKPIKPAPKSSFDEPLDDFDDFGNDEPKKKVEVKKEPVKEEDDFDFTEDFTEESKPAPKPIQQKETKASKPAPKDDFDDFDDF